jgi:NAD(P)-dependent dehydrogenase (short-subunit alcohol dehydrogenase family)
MGALASVSLARARHTVFWSMRGPEGRNADSANALRSEAIGTGSITVIELDVQSQDSADQAAAETI